MQTSILILLLLCFCSYCLPAQNLFANPDFEDVNVCTEFLATCAPEAWKEANYTRMVYLHGGNKGGKAGFVLSNVWRIRTYLFTELLCPLKAGEQYNISFDLNLRGAEFKPFGIYLSAENLSGRFDAKAVQPAIIFTGQNGPKKLKKMDWMPFKGVFTAEGGEHFFYLGYFETAIPGKEGTDWMQIVYLDNFRLVPQNKEIALCPEAEAKRAELYADDWRHMGFPDGQPPVDSTIRPETDVFEELPAQVEEVRAVPAAPRQPDTLVLAGVCFDFDKSTLNEHYAAVTDSLTDKIAARNPEKIIISGHTDNIGTDEFNLKLSLARAHTIEQVLIQKGVNAEQITCEGLGESRPVATNDTESGRAANRRIELVIFFND
ncbi:MAG: OmpA family protein [Saprospiraceae bacterium]|nr:OmpA family protein [Saprospiraceae bacterium]